MLAQYSYYVLVCPDCHSKLTFGDVIECTGCKRQFSTDEGIPVLLPKSYVNTSQDKQHEIEFFSKEIASDSNKAYDRHVYAALKESEYNELFRLVELEDGHGKLVLDYGCATGLSSILLGNLGYQVIGMDIVSTGLKQTSSILKQGETAPFGVVGDGEHTPFADNVFDVIFVGGVLHHFPNYELGIAECARILARGGILVILEPNRWDLLSTIKFRAGRHAGIQSKNEDTIDPRAFMKVLRKYFMFTELLWPEIQHAKYLPKNFWRDMYYRLSPTVMRNQFFVAIGVANKKFT